MMPARRDRPPASAAEARRLFQRSFHRFFDQLGGKRRHIERRDQSAERGVAPIARQRSDKPRRHRRIEPGKDVGRRRRALRHQQGDNRALRRLRQRSPHIGWSGLSGRKAENVGDLLRRQGVGEQALGLTGVAEQIGASRKISHEFLDQPVQHGRRDGAEARRGQRHRAQVRLIELLEQPRGRRLAHHEQQGCGFFGPAEFPFAADRRLGHQTSSCGSSYAVRSTASAGDDFQERHAESLTGLVDDDDFAARDHRAVDDDVDRIADALVKRDDRAAGELHEAGDRHRGRAEHDLHRHRDRQDRAEIGRARDSLRLRRVDGARRLGRIGGFVHGLRSCSLVSEVIAGNRIGSGLPFGRIGSLRDRALDFEPVAAVRLPELAGEHSAAGTFEANGGEVVAIAGTRARRRENWRCRRDFIGDLLEDGGHRKPRLLDAELHEPGPPPVGGRRLGVGIVGEFVAERQEKGLREQEEAFARRRRSSPAKIAPPRPRCPAVRARTDR